MDNQPPITFIATDTQLHSYTVVFSQWFLMYKHIQCCCRCAKVLNHFSLHFAERCAAEICLHHYLKIIVVSYCLFILTQHWGGGV